MNAKKKALGRGLSALLSDADYSEVEKTENSIEPTGSIPSIDINNIEINPFQPRITFDEDALMELSESIRQQGVIQPITVREISNNRYQLISGERRLRACKLAGFDQIPAFIREVNDRDMLEMALVENIQRENLNAIEIANSFQQLLDECHLTQEGLSEKVGKNRATVANYLRLLKLPGEIQDGIKNNRITMGHARALINVNELSQQIKIYHDIVEKELSVRDVEETVRNIGKTETTTSKPHKETVTLEEKYQSFQTAFSEKMDAKIQVKQNSKGKGNIIISFKSQEELDRIITFFNSTEK